LLYREKVKIHIRQGPEKHSVGKEKRTCLVRERWCKDDFQSHYGKRGERKIFDWKKKKSP